MATSKIGKLRLLASVSIVALTLAVSGCKTVDHPGRVASPEVVLAVDEGDLKPIVDLACNPVVLELALDLARNAKRRLKHPAARMALEMILAWVHKACKDHKHDNVDHLLALQKQLFEIQQQIEEQAVQQELLADQIEADRWRREQADAARDELARQRHQQQLDAIRREGEETRRRLEERFRRRASCGEYHYQIDGFCYDARKK